MSRSISFFEMYLMISITIQNPLMENLEAFAT